MLKDIELRFLKLLHKTPRAAPRVVLQYRKVKKPTTDTVGLYDEVSSWEDVPYVKEK